MQERAGYLVEWGSSMPTDVCISVSDRRGRDRKNAADRLAILFLLPLIACLFSIALAYESVAFETTLIQMGEDQGGQFGR